MRDQPTAAAVVVGIDGSRTAVQAALWAVDEAISRDIVLRLLYVIDPGDCTGIGPDDGARQLATAQIAVRHAVMAVEAADKAVNVDGEITHGRPIATLHDMGCSLLVVDHQHL